MLCSGKKYRRAALLRGAGRGSHMVTPLLAKDGMAKSAPFQASAWLLRCPTAIPCPCWANFSTPSLSTTHAFTWTETLAHAREHTVLHPCSPSCSGRFSTHCTLLVWAQISPYA